MMNRGYRLSMIFFAAAISLQANAADGLRLRWDANTEADLSHYNAYRSRVSGGPYTMLNAVPITTTTFIDARCADATTYYYVVTAVDFSGNESAYSEEVSATMPPRNEGGTWGTVIIRRPLPGLDAQTTSTYWTDGTVKEFFTVEKAVVKESFTTESLPTGETWSDNLPIQPPDAEKPLWKKILYWGTVGH